jgi:LysM repeat protein
MRVGPGSRSRFFVGALVACACLVCDQHDVAAFPYTAQRGDTLAELAERFYGKVEMEKVLVAANGFDGDVPMLAGMRVEVPAVSYRHVRAGESWNSLAETLLGDARRGEALALSNETMPWVPPVTGREIVVPYPLRYVVKKGESTLSVAYHFLGKRDLAYVVDRYNHLKGEPVEPGDVLIVPVTDLVLTDEGREAARASLAVVAGESGGDDRDAQDQSLRELPLLEKDVREGRYLEAIARGNQLVGAGTLTEPELGAIYRQLVEALVALDAFELASDACHEWRRNDPEAVLDPMELSPKIMRACAAADGNRGVGPVGSTFPSASAAPSSGPSPLSPPSRGRQEP